MKILLVDKDGTITKPIDGRFTNTPDNQEPIGGAYEFLERFSLMGYSIAVVSNQGGVGAGHKSLEDATAEMRRMLDLFPMVDIACFCPDKPIPKWLRWIPIVQWFRSQCHVVSRTGGDYPLDFHLFDEDFILAGGKSRHAVFRKPGALMLWCAVHDQVRHSSRLADVENLVMVGDRPEDYLASHHYPFECSFISASAIPIFNKFSLLEHGIGH